MIANFANKLASDIYDGTESKKARKIPSELHPKVRRLFDQLNSAPSLEFMRVPPGNRLEKLSGDLKGLWSVRVNDQWRVVFRWQGEDACDVDIIDYH